MGRQSGKRARIWNYSSTVPDIPYEVRRGRGPYISPRSYASCNYASSRDGVLAWGNGRRDGSLGFLHEIAQSLILFFVFYMHVCTMYYCVALAGLVALIISWSGVGYGPDGMDLLGAWSLHCIACLLAKK
jgi:hypothetical protein